MGQGYTRNDVSNNIANGNVINAADLDGEFDAIESAFVAATGHTHDGTDAEGGAITVIGPVQDFVADATSFTAKTANAYDLGKTATRFKDAYINGVTYTGTINLGGTAITATAAEINYIDGVTSAIQTQLDGKQPLSTVLTNTTASFTTAEETKLAGIEAGADVNVPTNLGNTPSGTGLTITSSTGDNTDLPAATTTAWGAMTDEDKSKLDGIEANATADQTGAEIKTAYEGEADTNAFTDALLTKLNGIEESADVNVATNLGVTANGTSLTVTSSTGTNASIPAVTTTAWGAMTDEDKSKLNGIESGATADQTKADIDALGLAYSSLSGLPTLGSLAALSTVNAATITDNSVGAAELNVTGNGTTAQFLRSDGDGTFTWATPADTVYTHPTHPGDDFSVDTGPLTGATVVSDIDINVTTDTLGHVTDANGSVATRTLTLADLGYTGATNATANVGDITGVTAGTNLTGGGTSGSVTLNVSDTPTFTSMTVDLMTIGPNGAGVGFTSNNGLYYFIDGTDPQSIIIAPDFIIGGSPQSCIIPSQDFLITCQAGDQIKLEPNAGNTGNVINEGVIWENPNNINANYTISDNYNAMSAGPITINTGITVTIGDGEVWTVV